MASVDLDLALLNSAHPKKRAEYLRRVRKDGANDLPLCQALSDAVSSKRIRPSVLTGFFSCKWNKTPELAGILVKHGSGVTIRRLAISLAGRLLARQRKWEVMWKTLGGLEGLVTLFATASVHEVKLLSHVVMSCGFSPRIPAREKAIEALVKALLPDHYPESHIQTQDKRPLQHLYGRMLPACSAEFVNTILDAKDYSNPLYMHCHHSKLMKAHRGLMRKRVEAAALGEGVRDEYTQSSMRYFFYHNSALAVNAIKLRLKKEDAGRWPGVVDELDLITHYLKKTMKRYRVPSSEVRSMLSLTLDIAQANQRRVHDLWPVLCSRWQKEPAIYEDLFIKALRFGLAAPEMDIGQPCHTHWYGKSCDVTWNWVLLRLYCLHVPKDGIDIDTATDLKPLANRAWPVGIFFKISKEQALRLLTGLYAVNPDYNFLNPDHDSSSILKFRKIESMAWRNFNVELLKAMLEKDGEEGLAHAKTVVDKLRKKASTSKEQSDRAEIARAASVYAIASGDLDLYKETIIWQQRFVRDSLTVKTLFSADVIVSTEGVELLAGISEQPPEAMSLDEIAARVAKADEILIALHETRLLAEPDPSYHWPDWEKIHTLTWDVLKRRAQQMQRLMSGRLFGKNVEAFSVLWESGLRLADYVNGEIGGLEDFYREGCPPVCLVAITKMMLDSMAERRKRKNVKSEDKSLETMSYRAINSIANGEEPGLATPLILQFVLGRPDASSLHRHILSVGLLKTLPAVHAQQMLLDFATGIGEKLEEQSYVKIGEPEKSITAPPQSLIKVTTAKYLAQLLYNAEYISADAAIESLIELFNVANHRDIRLATLESLLNSLNDMCNGPEEIWRSNPFLERILKSLETIIPVTASINERRPPTEEEWQEATGKAALPEVSDISEELPPLLQAILLAPEGDQYPNLDELQPEFVTRLILPILAGSQEAHQRWISLFLAKYEASFGVENLPPTPISPKVWETILPEYCHLFPSKVLEDYYQYITATSVLSAELRSFNESLRSDTALRNNPEVQHWLKIYDRSTDDYNTSGLDQLLDIILNLHYEGASIQRASDMVVGLVSAILQDYENHFKTWSDFVEQLEPPRNLTTDTYTDPVFDRDYKLWKDIRQPILEKVTALLLDLKHQQARHPASGGILPSALQLQILLLPYPNSVDREAVEAESEIFVAKLDELILSSLQSDTNVLQWVKISEATSKISDMICVVADRLRMALHVGQLKSQNATGTISTQVFSALNLVRLKTALMLIEDGWRAIEHGLEGNERERETYKDLARRLKIMVQEWQAHSDDSVALEVLEWRRMSTKIWSMLMKA